MSDKIVVNITQLLCKVLYITTMLAPQRGQTLTLTGCEGVCGAWVRKGAFGPSGDRTHKDGGGEGGAGQDPVPGAVSRQLRVAQV